MKHFKLLLSVLVLMSALAFTSCIKGEDTKPWGQAMVTVELDMFDNPILYADGGGVLKPSLSSVQALGGLKNVKRAIVRYELQDGFVLEEGSNEYLVNLLFCQPYLTVQTIDTYNNEAADSLAKNNDAISKFLDMYAYRGYITAITEVPYGKDAPYFNMAFNHETSIVPTKDTLNLTMYYDARISTPPYSTETLTCYELPKSLQYLVPGQDSIVIAVTATVKNGLNGTQNVTKYSKMKVKEY